MNLEYRVYLGEPHIRHPGHRVASVVYSGPEFREAMKLFTRHVEAGTGVHVYIEARLVTPWNIMQTEVSQ